MAGHGKREYDRLNYLEKGDQIRDRAREWSRTHVEEKAEYNRAYRAANIEKERARSQAYKAGHKDQILAKFRARKYNVPTEWADETLKAQGSCCAICREPITLTSPVDHDHSTGLARAMVCDRCNIRLGHLEAADWDDWVGKANLYLEYHGAPAVHGLLGWYAQFVHNEHVMASGAVWWTTCNLWPCFHLRTAVVKGIPTTYTESDGAGSY